ncbi:MAG: DNA polymerase, partial [bacterium]|nr:DNA polymerase [bacterium]
ALLKLIRKEAPDLNPFSSLQLGELLSSRGIIVPLTEKGNDSVGNDFLASLDDPLAGNIGVYRKSERLRSAFIKDVIIDGSYKGKLHPSYFSTRGSSFMSGGDEGGTRSGRLSSNNPNIQQIPSRHPTLGPLIRSMFIPEDGQQWCKLDWSQQEPRIALHYACLLGLPGAQEMRQAYIDDPTIDYHTLVMDMVNKIRTIPINRREAKDINLGLNYGMGRKKMSDKLGLSLGDSDRIISSFHSAITWMKALQNKAMSSATDRGFVKTILGRRRRFTEYEPTYYKKGNFPVNGYENAVDKYGTNVRRSGIHRALNSVVQGSAAESMKMAMVMMHKEGMKILLSVHDEVGLSITSTDEAKKAKEIMETCIKFEVPQYVNPTIGKSWGDTK